MVAKQFVQFLQWECWVDLHCSMRNESIVAFGSRLLPLPWLQPEMSEKLRAAHALKEKGPEGSGPGQEPLGWMHWGLWRPSFFCPWMGWLWTWVCDPRVSETGSASRGSPDEVRYARRVACSRCRSSFQRWRVLSCETLPLSLAWCVRAWNGWCSWSMAFFYPGCAEEVVDVARRRDYWHLQKTQLKHAQTIGVAITQGNCAPGLVDTNLTLENKTTKVWVSQEKNPTQECPS